MFVFNPGNAARLALIGVWLGLPLPAGAQPVPAGDQMAQVYPRQGCLSRREAIGAVVDGRAKPLRELRQIAEEAAGGEMISADMCPQNGGFAYVLTILASSGKVAYVTLDAASGRVLNVR